MLMPSIVRAFIWKIVACTALVPKGRNHTHDICQRGIGLLEAFKAAPSRQNIFLRGCAPVIAHALPPQGRGFNPDQIHQIKKIRTLFPSEKSSDFCFPARHSVYLCNLSRRPGTGTAGFAGILTGLDSRFGVGGQGTGHRREQIHRPVPLSADGLFVTQGGGSGNPELPGW